MPELPEVETLRRDLEPVVVGRRIRRVSVTGARTVRRLGPANLTEGAGGREVVSVRRHGKYLLWDLDDGATLVVHLRMSGQLRLSGAADRLAPHTHVVLGFDRDTEVRFVDPRTFGEVFVVADGRLAELAPGVAGLGPDALNAVGTRWPSTVARLQRRVPVKSLLTDQRVIAGIGNIYADEIAHAAGVRPDRPGCSIRPDELVALRAAIPKVLRAAIRSRGSSLADEQYVDLHGRIGRYQLLHRVHARAGAACPRCGSSIVRVRLQGRSTYFCPGCQR